jgi:hypothetical protein
MNRRSPVLSLSLVSVVLAALHAEPAAAQTSSIADCSFAGHKFSAYPKAGVGYAWAHLDRDLFGFAGDRPVTITDSNGYTVNTGLDARYYLWDNFFIEDVRYRYLNRLTSAYGQGLNTAETTLSLGYQF